MKRSFAGALVLAVFMLGGCGGGSSTPPANKGGGGGSSDTATLPISITIPAATSARRRANVSPYTQSVAVFVYAQGGTAPTTPTTTANVGSGDSGCTSGTSGVTCTIDVTAPVGTDELTIEAYSGQNGTGTLLSTVTQTQTVTTGMQAVAVTLSGVPATILLSLETPVLSSGTAGTAVLDVNALDASGALIAAPGNFSAPLTISSDSNDVSLSATTADAPGTKITITYSGGSAPYAIHLTASGGGIASNRIVGATLDIAPSESMVFLSGSGSQLVATTVATNALNDAPQQVRTFSSSLGDTDLYGEPDAFTILPNGTLAVVVNNGSCQLLGYPSGVSSQSNPVAVTSGYETCAIAGESNDDVLVSSGAPGLAEYSFSSTGAATATGRTLSLASNPLSIAVGSTGEIAALSANGTQVSVYAANASGAASPSFTISVANAIAVAFSSSGTIAVLTSASGQYGVSVYSSTGASLGTIAPPAPASGDTVTAKGIAFDSAGEILVQQTTTNASYTQSNSFVDVYSPGTYGSVSAERSVPLSTQAGNAFVFAGPVVVTAPTAPSASSSVSGDMLGYEANRTWTYEVTPGYGGTPYYLGVYADPQQVDGNIRLVGFQSASSSNLFTSANEIGSADFTPQNGTYLAADFASVASGTDGVSGSVPGTPLFVPGTLSLNQNWNPLQNASLLTGLTGITTTAQVVAVGSVSGISACPGNPTSGATVEYSVTGTVTNSEDVSYVPGCGITALTNLGNGNNDVVLQSVSTDASLGQQTVQLGRSSFMSTLHGVWQHLFNVRPPTR